MKRSWIPNGITIAALGCGVLAILFIARAIAAGGSGPDWVYGAALIFPSGLLDGLVCRLRSGALPPLDAPGAAERHPELIRSFSMPDSREVRGPWTTRA